jgi:hypothetical protein
MEQIANLAILLLGFATFIYAVTRTEYEKCEKCDPEDCQYCPFPRCENTPKDLTKTQLRKMDGQTVTVVTDDSVFPVRVSVQNGEVWVVNQFGSSTTYDDVKKQGGKFFEKVSD